MRADLVELLAPVCDQHAAFAQGVEHIPSQSFPPELVVEALMLLAAATKTSPRNLTFQLAQKGCPDQPDSPPNLH